MNRLRCAAAFLVLVMTGCAAKTMAPVALTWKPTDNVSSAVQSVPPQLSQERVQVAPFTDSRKAKEIIGRNVENKDVRVVVSHDDVGAWCAEQMKGVLQAAGVPIVDAGGSLLVTGDVKQFLVEEGNTYEGAVTLQLSVASSKGVTIWKGPVAGQSRRWGRSYKRENYLETLSDAYLQAMQELFRDQSFRSALAQRAR